MDQILEATPDEKVTPWQMNIIDRQPQTIKCSHKRGIICTLTIPSTACLTCDNYIVRKNGPGAIRGK